MQKLTVFNRFYRVFYGIDINTPNEQNKTNYLGKIASESLGKTSEERDPYAYSTAEENAMKSLDIVSKDLQPELTNSDFFVNPNRSIVQGVYSGSVIGSIPIFAGGGAVRLPYGLYEKRRQALQNQVGEKLKELQKPLDYKIPDIDSRYKESFNNSFLNGINDFISRAQNKYGEKAMRMLENQNTPLGQEYKRFLENSKAFAENTNEVVNIASELQKDEKAGAYIPRESKESMAKILSGMGDFENGNMSTHDIPSEISKLKKFKNLQLIMKDEWAKIDTDIRASYETSKSNGNIPASTSYYDFFSEKSREFLSPERIKFLANSISIANPNDIYNPEISGKRYDQPYDVKDVENYIKGMIGNKEKINSLMANKPRPSSGGNTIYNIGNTEPKDRTAFPTAVGNVYQKLTRGEKFVVNKENYIVPSSTGSGGFTAVINGQSKFVPFSNKDEVMNAMIGVMSADPTLTGTSTSWTQADQLNYARANGLGYQLAQYDKPVDASKFSPTINYNVPRMVNTVSQYGGGLSLDGNNIKNANGDSYNWNMTLDDGRVGVFVPKSTISDSAPLTEKGYSVSVGNEYIFVEGAKYSSGKGETKYKLVNIANGNELKLNDAKSVTVNKSAIDNLYTSKFNNAKKSIVTPNLNDQQYNINTGQNLTGKPQIGVGTTPASWNSWTEERVNKKGVRIRKNPADNKWYYSNGEVVVF